MIWTTAELLDGQTEKQLRAAVRAGRLHPVIYGFYSDEEPDDLLTLTTPQDVRGLVFTGRTAMSLYLGEPVEWPAQARHRGTARTTAQVIVRSRVPARVREGSGLTIVTPLQAAMDADRPDDDLRAFLADAYPGIGAQDVLEQDLAALVNGKARARKLLAATAAGAASLLERKAFGIICAALEDLPVTVLVNRIVGNYCYDLVIPEARVVVEIDSFMYHAAGGAGTTVGSFVKDAWKGNEAAHLGWVLLRYTNYCIHEAPEEVARDLRRVVAPRITRRGVELPGPPGDPVWPRHPAARR
ncbi:hypothetical protein [Corynebacterium glyciniphilum]|uniref:hypothetical protein n=1 Tax=Corynebacterium glyciniphilum TaxID=1404244 RepID=UPI00264DCF59|nr:hypothetical protein [Corynebacterium glyciniphilum]MDN5683052.1 hypothetical protein [Corynebacterium glyciniphilum]MDN6704576.1 hypothetical protein [Corynebacterium glyciniphilum]